ncbi:hypothetical protein [Endozoicomonas euniceicola]|uniref:Uncharacterized protein n=1 Tax=Endozoicomonas euniceicola TaxID=1234143 RepID=A0ABY6GSF3_9GAMM|nr:hypothetical protein [Endozoicomonas euniceicola]UYM15674.1 hypothetical protein NX720_23050 [Endozoicomonas euniceicola]
MKYVTALFLSLLCSFSAYGRVISGECTTTTNKKERRIKRYKMDDAKE